MLTNTTHSFMFEVSNKSFRLAKMTTAASSTLLMIARSGILPDLIGSNEDSYISGALSKLEKTTVEN